VIAATNRADILDPALMRSGRLDRKIEFPHPTEEARARILQVCCDRITWMSLFTCISCQNNSLNSISFSSDVVDPLKEDERPS